MSYDFASLPWVYTEHGRVKLSRLSLSHDELKAAVRHPSFVLPKSEEIWVVEVDDFPRPGISTRVILAQKPGHYRVVSIIQQRTIRMRRSRQP